MKIHGTTGSKKDGLLSEEQQKALDRRQYQCAKRVEDYWGRSNGDDLYPEIAMPTGFGKGRVVHRLLKSSQLDQILTIVGSKNILLNQSREVLEGLAIEDTGETDFSILPDLSGRTVLTTWQGLTAFSRTHTRRPNFGLAVVDEVHNIGTPRRMELLDWLRPDHVVGLTATAHRASGGFRAPEEYGFTVVDSMPLPECIDKRWLSPLMGVCIDTQVMLPSTIRRGMGEINQKKMAQALRQYPQLFQDIANDIADRFLSSGMKTIIVVNRVKEEACMIAEELMQRGFKVGLAINQHAAKKLCHRFITLDAIERYKLPMDHPNSIQILISPQVIGEGFDAPATECVVWAAPTMSHVRYTQVIGRGSRRCWQKKYCLVVDYVYLIENYGYSLNFAQFFQKKDMKELDNGFMYVGPKNDGRDIILPSRFSQGGKIVSVVDLRRMHCPPAGGWLTAEDICRQIKKRGKKWIRDYLANNFATEAELRKTAGILTLHYPPETVIKLQQVVDSEIPCGNWLTANQISFLCGYNNHTITRALESLGEKGEKRLSAHNQLLTHYPPKTVKQVKKVLGDFPDAGSWLTIEKVAQVVGKTDAWVGRRLKKRFSKLAEFRLDGARKPLLHYPPSVLATLKKEAKQVKRKGNWLVIADIATTLKVGEHVVRNRVRRFFSDEYELRLDRTNKPSPHFPPTIVAKIRKVL